VPLAVALVLVPLAWAEKSVTLAVITLAVVQRDDVLLLRVRRAEGDRDRVVVLSALTPWALPDAHVDARGHALDLGVAVALGVGHAGLRWSRRGPRRSPVTQEPLEGVDRGRVRVRRGADRRADAEQHGWGVRRLEVPAARPGEAGVDELVAAGL